MTRTRLIGVFVSLFAPLSAFAAPPATAPAPKRPVRVLIWDEQQPEQKQAYGDKFLGETIAEALSKNPGLKVTSAAMPPKGKADDDPSLTVNSLDNTDVLIWWGHVRHREVRRLVAEKIIDRVQENKLALISLHSAHWSSPFVAAMNARTIEQATRGLTDQQKKLAPSLIYPSAGAPKADAPLTPSFTKTANKDGTVTLVINLPNCAFPSWRADGKPSHVRTMLPKHPIAQGLPAAWDVPQTEMYSEPFHVPAPDLVIFEERWDAGERFRSGMLWSVGKGRVFYFRPGHETYPVYKEKFPLMVVENAAAWLGAQVRDGVDAEPATPAKPKR
jgi:trehalose utilization protein